MTKEHVDAADRQNADGVVTNGSEMALQSTNGKAGGVGPERTQSSDENASGVYVPQPKALSNNENGVDADETDGELLERMRADAVGETMYSKKYILQTLMKLSQQPAETGLGLELEDDLCKVWDMSVAPEVVSLLLENDAIELIMFAISSSDDVRLYEILIGLLGNMCAKLQCVEQLTAHPEWVEMLLKLTTCMDTCMLLQLMRVYQYVMAHVVSGKEQLGIDWYICFAAFDGSARNLGFILQQSVSDELLLAALKAINSVLASCALVEEENARTDLKLRPFADVFLVPELCDGVNNAFIRLMRDDLAKQADEIDAETGAQITADTELDDDDCGEDLNVPKISCDVEVIQTYLNICTILVQLPEAQTSMNLYVSSIMFCLTRILQFLQQPMQLIPMGERQEEYLEDLAHICSCLKYYYNSATFINLLAVWVSLKLHINNYVDLDEHDFEAFDDEPLSQYEENAFKVLRLLAHMLIKADAAVILSDIKGIDALQVNMFRAALQAEQEEDVVLQKALERLHVVFNELNGQAK